MLHQPYSQPFQPLFSYTSTSHYNLVTITATCIVHLTLLTPHPPTTSISLIHTIDSSNWSTLKLPLSRETPWLLLCIGGGSGGGGGGGTGRAVAPTIVQQVFLLVMPGICVQGYKCAENLGTALYINHSSAWVVYCLWLLAHVHKKLRFSAPPPLLKTVSSTCDDIYHFHTLKYYLQPRAYFKVIQLQLRWYTKAF